MREYLDLAARILAEGELRTNRTGTDTIGVFGHQMRYNLREGFPLLTTKKLHWKSIAYELLWFLRGDSNVAYLQEHGVRIWNEWARPDGSLGPIYGVQWRAWPTADRRHIDQLAQVVHDIKHNPDSRRLIVSAWNVGELARMALPPCHILFQFYVQRGRLSCQLYQRSADVFLGVPFNIASYALLTHLIAHTCQLEVGDFVHTLGDAHIYTNHTEAVETQLQRSPLPLPRLAIHCPPKAIDEYTFEDFSIEGYTAHPHIPGIVAV